MNKIVTQLIESYLNNLLKPHSISLNTLACDLLAMSILEHEYLHICTAQVKGLLKDPLVTFLDFMNT